MSGSKTQVVYWTATMVNSTKDEAPATITENFSQALVERASDYVLAVERFEVNLNGVPFYDISNAEILSINYNALTYNLDFTNDIQFNIFSLDQLISDMNTQFQSLAIFQTANGNFSINIDPYGFIYFSWNNTILMNMTFVIPPILNQCLGFSNNEAYDVDPVPHTTFWYSKYPRFDCGDECQHVRLTSNLSLVSDTVGQAKTNVVTDVANPVLYNTSTTGDVTTFSFSARQKLNYQPNERRWLNFAAPVPITYMTVTAEYVRADGTSDVIMLPVGGCFAIKLGFYYRQ